MAEAAVQKEQQKEDRGTNELIEQQLQDLDNVDAEEEQRQEERRTHEVIVQQDLNQGMDTGTHSSVHREVNWGPNFRVRSPKNKLRRYGTQSRHSSKNAVACARTSRISRLHAYGRWVSRPVTSVAICTLCRRPARSVWWARMHHMPGARYGAQAPDGSISIQRTIAFRRSLTSRSHGDAIIATSVPSMVFSWAVRGIR
jgi:hypothetical protein